MESQPSYYKQVEKRWSQLYVNCSRMFQRCTTRRKYQKIEVKQSSHQSSKREAKATAKTTEASICSCVPGQMFTKVLQRRTKSWVERALAEEQACFRPGRGTTGQIFTIRQIMLQQNSCWDKMVLRKSKNGQQRKFLNSVTSTNGRNRSRTTW